MAFTDPQINDIAVVINMTPTLLNAHLSSLGTTLTADIETKVLEQVTRWEAGVGSNNVRVFPKERNFGAKIDPNDDRFDVKNRIRTWLEIPAEFYGGGSSYGSIPIVL